MREYEISDNNKVLGKIKLYINNISNDLINSILLSNINYKKIKKENNVLQKYIIKINVNNDDELYEVVSKYCNKDIFEEIDKIKKYNNIKSIKKNTIIKIFIDSNKLYLFNKSVKDINLDSLLDSKFYFIDCVLNNIKLDELENKYNLIKDNYNVKKNNSTYEFLLDEEKESIINDYLEKIDYLIKYVENNTNYKYGIDFVKEIEID